MAARSPDILIEVMLVQRDGSLVADLAGGAARLTPIAIPTCRGRCKVVEATVRGHARRAGRDRRGDGPDRRGARGVPSHCARAPADRPSRIWMGTRPGRLVDAAVAAGCAAAMRRFREALQFPASTLGAAQRDDTRRWA